jgi:hypothetical protein
MSSIQEVFNKVIECRLYPTTEGVIGSSSYMCHALAAGRRRNIISVKNYYTAVDAIKEYLVEYSTLGSFLVVNGYNPSTTFKLNLYKNWNDRPLRK